MTLDGAATEPFDDLVVEVPRVPDTIATSRRCPDFRVVGRHDLSQITRLHRVAVREVERSHFPCPCILEVGYAEIEYSLNGANDERL